MERRSSGRNLQGSPAQAGGTVIRITRMIAPDQLWNRLVLALAVTLAVAGSVAAQESVSANAPPTEAEPRTIPADAASPSRSQAPAASRPAESRSPLDAIPTAIRYLPNKLGELVPVPANATLEGYLEFLARPRNTPERDAVPAATVTSIELTGEAVDDRATVVARLEIQLRQPNEFVRVPLFLNEAVLTKSAYKGQGEAVFDEKDRDHGHVWWFRGPNPHQLELSLSVPVRRQLPIRRMQLTLPVSPVASLTLVVPHRSITARSDEKIPLETKSLPDDRSQIDAFGLGRRVDLNWQPNPEVSSSAASLEVNTMILAQVDFDTVLLDVHQRLQSLQGSFDSFAVQLPADAQNLKIEDDGPAVPESQGAGYRSHQMDPAKPGRVVVSLTKAAVGPVRLRWTVTLPRTDRKRVVLDGFVVENARRQSGEIGLAPHDGLRLSPTQQRDTNILRIYAAELKSDVTGAQVTRAYRFLSQPFRLVVGVEPIEPYYLVDTRTYLTGAAHQLSLDTAFQFHVYRESLTEVTIAWPEWKSDGWIIEGFDPPDLVEAASTGDENGSFRLRLVKRQSGQFQIRMRARRATKPTEDVAFTLPRAKASTPSNTTLFVVNAENVETELTKRGETVAPPLPASPPEAAQIPESVRGLKSTAYRIDTEEQAFALRVLPQPRRVRTESASEATWKGDRIQIAQRISYDVAYERLSQLRLKVPQELPPERFRFFAERDVELPVEWSDGPDPGTRIVRLALPEPRIGHFEVQAQFFIGMTEDTAFEGDTTVSIPILQSFESAFHQTRFSLARADRIEASAVSELWKPQPLRPEAWTWLAEGARAEFGLRIARAGGSADGTASVSKGLITTIVDQAGRSLVRAQFRIAARSATLSVNLPPTAQSPQFYWDRTPLVIGATAIELAPNSRKFSLTLPSSRGVVEEDRLLTVDYQQSGSASANLTSLMEFQSPQLPQCSWVAQVVWQTVLLPDQHLFTYPASATPMFRWRRQGLFWYRVSDPDSGQLQRWIGGESGPPLNEPVALASQTLNRNLYAFSQIGAPRGMEFRTLSSPMIVLVGAGISLAVGFILLRVRALRHLLTALVAALVIAIIGLWNSAPFELLLQPMIVGLLFPAMAVFIETWFRKRFGGTVLTLPTPNEVAAAHAQRVSDMLSYPNAAEPTRISPPVLDGSASMHAEAGSGVS
jgi:hypothetical protein